MRHALTSAKWLAPAAALFALACALLAPAEAGVASGRRRARQQNNHVEQEEPTGDSSVRGRVVYDDTSRPVRRARVMLITNAGGHSDYAALTDARGEFAIDGVRAGTYYAFVDAPGVLSPVGFVSIEEMRATSGMADLGEGRNYFDRIEVDGKEDVTVTVRARRGASLAGRVSYADGDPAVNVGVTLMRRSADGRLRRYLTGASVASMAGLRTDDRGMFRLMGLPPGEYLVGVSESVHHGAEGIRGGAMGDDVPGAFRGMFGQQLLMTFYPSATGVKGAGVVKVEAGEERADVDITIPERELRLLGGVVRARRGGRPVPGAHVTIVRRDDPLAQSRQTPSYYYPPESGANGTRTDAEGRWSLREIPDGPYTIHVKPPEEYEEAPAVAYVNMNSNAVVVTNANVAVANASDYRPPRRKRSYAPTRRDLEVSADVTDLVVEVADGARVTGTISVEGGSPPRYGHVYLMRVGEGEAGSDAGSQYGSIDGGRFTVEGLPAGRFTLQPPAGGADPGIYVKSMTWNGRDLLREPLEVAEGASVDGVRIVYGRNPATLHVTVRGAAGRRPPEEFFVVLVPADLSGWSPQVQPRFCATGGEGTCPVLAPPGEYRVLAVRRVQRIVEEVRGRAPSAPRVTLREGETTRFEVDAPPAN